MIDPDDVVGTPLWIQDLTWRAPYVGLFLWWTLLGAVASGAWALARDGERVLETTAWLGVTLLWILSSL